MRFKDITKDNHFKFSGFLYLLTDTSLSSQNESENFCFCLCSKSILFYYEYIHVCVCVFVRSTSDISSLPPTTKYISNDFIIYGKIHTYACC